MKAAVPPASRLRDGGRWTRLAILGAAVGCVVAFAIVLAWFPHNLWTQPLQADDAPAHYFMVRRLLDQGLSCLPHLSPDNSFYPPGFALFAAAIVKAFGVSITAGVAAAWVVAGGLIYPAGVAVLTGQFIRGCRPAARVLAVTLAPVLTVLLPGHPSWTLWAGPLLAYSLSLSLLPWLLATVAVLLRRLTALLDGRCRPSTAVRALVAAAVAGLVELVCQPRIGFAALMVVLPMLVAWLIAIRHSHRRLAGIVTGVTGVLLVIGAVACGFVAHRHYGPQLWHPSTWFNQQALLTDWPRGLVAGLTGGLFDHATTVGGCTYVAAVVMVVLAVAAWRRCEMRPIIVGWVACAVVFTFSVASSWWLWHIAVAPWYGDPNRIVGMIGAPLVVVAARGAIEAADWLRGRGMRAWIGFAAAAVAVALLFACCLVSQKRAELGATVQARTDVDTVAPDAPLTRAKLDAFAQIKQTVAPDALLFADPYTGLQYIYPLDDIAAYFRIINPNFDQDPQQWTAVEAFASGDPTQLLSTWCQVGGTHSQRYFVDFGAQFSTDLERFGDFAALRDSALTDRYVAAGALVQVATYPSGQARPFTLYRVAC